MSQKRSSNVDRVPKWAVELSVDHHDDHEDAGSEFVEFGTPLAVSGASGGSDTAAQADTYLQYRYSGQLDEHGNAIFLPDA